MRRVTVSLVAVAAVVVIYAGLDAADTVPGYLTTRPLPPPPPTETVAPRVLPVVPQPTQTATSVPAPLPALADEAKAPTVGGVSAVLASVMASPALADSSVMVRDGQSGAVLYDRNGSLPRIPASTTKVLSAAAISSVFTSEARLTTKVVAGSAPGQVVLVAGGDSLLAPGKGDPAAVAGHAGLGDLADQTAAALARTATTSITLFVDTSYADGPLLAPTWSGEFRPTGITGAVAMLGRSDQRALPGRPGPADPVQSVRLRFAELLRGKEIGVTVAAGASPAVPPSATVLASVESAPVREQLALALTESDNALTEILARQAAFVALKSGAALDFASVGSWVVATAATLGIPTEGMVLRDASGLSRENRVTAASLSQVLVLAYSGTAPVLREAVAGLPIAGLTGTLAGRFGTERTHVVAGRARAKTGTLTGANSLAGVVVDDAGRLLVYSVLVADAPTLDARAAADRVVAALGTCGCR